MTAAASDLLQEVGIATATTLDAPGYTIGANSITVASTSGMPTATGITVAIDVIDSNGEQVPGSYNEYVGVVTSATAITSLSHANGTDRNYSAGSTTRVYIPVSAERENRIVEWGTAEHNQDGTHSDITADTLTVSGATVLGGTQGRLGDIVTFTASGTWTKDANLKFIVVEAVGGGGGGGGSGTNATRGGGGGGGGYSRKKIAAASLGSTETVTIGAAGTAGAAGNNNGGNGGNTTFGSHMTAGGGTGGNAASGAFASDTGGTASGGDLNITGGEGVGRRTSGAEGGARGGTPPMGFGMAGQSTLGSTSQDNDGRSGTGYGVGGGGGYRSTANAAGGAGTAGIVIVYEYY